MLKLPCRVIVNSPKPRVFKGQYFPEEMCGVYGFRKRNSFAIPSSFRETINTIIKRKIRDVPVFVVDSETSLAQPVGKTILNEVWNLGEKDKPKAKLQMALEVATQKKYVKEAVAKAKIDTIQMLLIMFAGVGLTLAGLTIISVLTKTPITFGA